MIGAVTAGCCEHECEREMDERDACIFGKLRERVRSVELALVLGQREVVAQWDARRPRAFRRRLALAPTAAQPAAGERAPRDDGHAEPPAERQHLGLDAAHEDRVGRLLGDEPGVTARLGDPLRGHDLARRIRRRADVADLARTHEIGECAERLVVIGVVVEAVNLVEVDPVRAEPAEAVLALLDDPAARVAALVRAFAHRAVHLRGEHDLVTAPFERLRDDLLRLTA